jgi:hypothetical protein
MILDLDKISLRNYNKSFKAILEMSHTDINDLPLAKKKADGTFFP